MKLVDGSVFNHQEILLIEDPSIANRIISELSNTDFNALSKIGPSGREDWMTNPAVLAMAMRLGKVFLVQNSKNNVHKAALTFQESTSSEVEVFDGSTDAFHKNFKLNSELADTVKFSLKHLFKNATEPVNARDSSASISEEGADSQSSSQTDDSEIEYNKGLGKKADKQKTESDSSSESDLGTDVAPATKTEEEKPEDERKCETCGKPYDENCPGSNDEIKFDFDVKGSGSKLTKSIAIANYGGDITTHPWHYKTIRSSLEAHHLIVSQVMTNSPDVKQAAQKFGYNINHEMNGVMLPFYMELACHLTVPMHRSNHNATFTDTAYVAKDKQDSSLKFDKVKNKDRNKEGGEVFMPYPQAVAKKVRSLLKDSKNNEECQFENGENIFIEEMESISEEILDYVKTFTWTLTSDGKDYEGGKNGCGNPNASTEQVNNGWAMRNKNGLKCGVRKLNSNHIFQNDKKIQKKDLEIGM
ncbi:MAG: AHH domain-containing protein [Pseudomonadales bacterium]|nr:AHH domain-containing protein [Pseudomonadales bacterium]